ncbi:MAG TPA: hypothetical protein VIF88_03790 [Methylocystis sp.]|jgi:hypothetical protein
MPWPLSLPARKNGRRLARDESPESGNNDIHVMCAWAIESLTRSEIGRVIAMLQAHLDKPDEADALPKNALGEDARRRARLLAHDEAATATKSFYERFPEARRIKQAM